VTSDGIGQEQILWDALNHLQSGLDLLDRASAPAHIGARVDLAMHELKSVLAADDATSLQRSERRREK
jgi:hypothetical protein